MSDHHNNTTHQQEIDLTDIFSVIGRFFRGILHFIFRVIDFMVKVWWVLLVLVLAGIALGYFANSNVSYTANLLVKTNFKSQSYVYNAVKQFDNNLVERDIDFIKNLNHNPETFSISGVSIDPVVEVLDLIAYIGENDRALGEMTREFKLEDDKELFATDRFLSTYKFHKLEVSLRSDQKLEDIKVLMSFINDQPYAKNLKAQGIESHKEFLNSQIKSVAQIDKLIESFSDESSVKGSVLDDGFYINNMGENLSELFDMKTMLVNNLEEYRNDEVSNKDVAVIVSDIQASKDNDVFKNWIVIYPLIFVLLFLIISGFWKSYRSYKREASTI